MFRIEIVKFGYLPQFVRLNSLVVSYERSMLELLAKVLIEPFIKGEKFYKSMPNLPKKHS